jgi:hypothetical protein
MDDVSESARPPLTADEKAQMRQWLENWRIAGPLLEEERWERLRTMTDDEAQQATRRVLELWQPDWPGDNGEGLLLHQRVFARARRSR